MDRGDRTATPPPGRNAAGRIYRARSCRARRPRRAATGRSRSRRARRPISPAASKAPLYPRTRRRGEEVARIGEAICADRAAIGQRESAAVVFAHVGARGPVDELDLEDHAALDHADFAGRDVDHAELGAEAKLVLLRDDEELAVRVEEILVA